MATIGIIDIILRAGTGEFAKDLGSAGARLARFAHDTHAGLISLASGFTALAASAGLVEMTKSSIEALDAMGDLAARIGTTTGEMQALRYAAKILGDEEEVINGALSKMNVILGDAAVQGGAAAKTLEHLGLDARQLAALDPARAFIRIGAEISKLPTPAEQASAAVDLFGKSGKELLNTLRAGPERIAELTAEAQRLGIVVGELDSSRIGAAQDALDRMNFVIQGVVSQISVKLAPVITHLGEQFLEFATKGEGSSRAVSDGFRVILSVADEVSAAVHNLKIVWLSAQVVIYNSMLPLVKGFGVLYDGVTTFRQGLNELAGVRQPHVEGLGEGISRDFDKLTGNKFKELEKEWNSSAVVISSAYERISHSSQAAAKGIAESNFSARDALESFAKLSEGVSSLEEKLRLQVDTFGASAAEVEIYKLQQQGATQAMIASAQALSDQLIALEENKKAQDALIQKQKEQQRQQEQDATQKNLKILDRSLDLIRESRSPLKVFQDQMKELSSLRTQGLIGKDTFDFQRAGAISSLKEKLNIGAEVQRAGAMELGSKEARTTLLNFREQARSDPAREILAAQKEQLIENQKQSLILDRIEKKLAPNNGLIDPETQLTGRALGGAL